MLGPIDRKFQPPLEGSRLDSAIAPGLAETPSDPADGFWIQRARDAYTSGKNWFDTSVRKQVEKNLANFRNEHPPGSKYHSELYQKKSRMFRPRTRAMVRRTEAAMCIAYFSTSDLVNVSAINDSQQDQLDAAEVHNQLINYRLENTIPWFQILMGGTQDAAITSVVISKQYWRYQKRLRQVMNVYEDNSYEPTYEEQVVEDRPCIELRPIENILIDPAADWLDPINASPYLVDMEPMYVYQIKEKMRRDNPRTGRPEYRQMSDGILQAGVQQDWDSIRKMRDGQRVDKYDSDTYINEYQVVWVHHNIVRVDGMDWAYDTLGVEIVLSDPEPLEDMYPHLEGRERPYALGTLMVEAHKIYSMSPVELVSGMQEELNDLANLRMDNVRLALNKRTFVRRGQGVDVATLIRNVPGSAVLMSDVDRDVKETQPQDVTASSYQEQDRMNLEFDEVSGTFSGSSVGSNRKLNETVGGMAMLNADASQVKEYEIRTLTETWVERVLRQLVLLEGMYENDREVLETVAARSQMPVERVLEVLKQKVRTRVNVGFNSTAPEKRIGKIMLALDGVAKYAPQILQNLNIMELLKEMFGAVGFRDGERFFNENGEDPQVAALKQQVAQLQQVIDTKQVEQQGKIEVARMTGEYRLAAVQLQTGVAAELGRIKAMIEAKKAQMQEIDAQLAIEAADNDRKELYMQREALSHEIQESNREFMLRLMEISTMAQQPKDVTPGKGKSPAGVKSKGAVNLPGNDKAGVISRDRFGMIPGAAG